MSKGQNENNIPTILSLMGASKNTFCTRVTGGGGEVTANPFCAIFNVTVSAGATHIRQWEERTR